LISYALKAAELLDDQSILAEFCGIEKAANPVGKSLVFIWQP
jgi:hypothetical protein